MKIHLLIVLKHGQPPRVLAFENASARDRYYRQQVRQYTGLWAPPWDQVRLAYQNRLVDDPECTAFYVDETRAIPYA